MSSSRLSLAWLALLVLLPVGPSSAQTVRVQRECPPAGETGFYFPAPDEEELMPSELFELAWFAHFLEAMDEPSLSCRGGDAVRFTWLRTFHHPVAVRVEWGGDDGARLTAVELGGAGGYEPGAVVRRLERVLSAEEEGELARVLQREDLFGMDPPSEESGLDGAAWILEGRRGGRYRVMQEWSPDAGPVRRMGLALLSLTGWEIEPLY